MAKSDISQASSLTKSAVNTAEGKGADYLGLAGTGYKDFAQTGGISPQQQQLTRQMAQGNIAGLYDRLKQNLIRRQSIQGGYSPGMGANMRSLGRETSAASSDAVNQTNLGLLELIRQGKLQGLGGLAGIGSEYLSQIPSLLGIGGKLATAKPGWMDLAQQGAELFLRPGG